MNKDKFIILTISATVISLITLSALYWTSASVVSGGFSDPKAIILLPNETRDVEISTKSIISQDVLVSLSVNDDGIGISTPCTTGTCLGVGMSLKRTTPDKLMFQLKILDSFIPPGEYQLDILLGSFPYQRIEIPIYVGYHIKDE